MSNPAATAGERYRLAWQIIQGGDAIGMLAGHITWMLGDNEWKRPVWRERSIPPDGKTFNTKSFDQYLLSPAREGLGLPTLLTVQKLCEANAQYGVKAIDMMRHEIGDYDEHIATDQRKVMAALPTRATHSEAGRKGGRGHKALDNIKSFPTGGTSSAYLIGKLKRDRPDLAERLAAGEFPSARAAAREAGWKIEYPLSDLRRAWAKASAEERAIFRQEISA